ncbi:MAG: hypothetical protein IJX88_06060, partial [Clostridia bacterium]|nr:hypothetical protein [Clostridia bacterium]
MVKKNLLKVMAIAAVLCTGFGTYGITASASEVKKSVTEVAWTMEQGAYVRMAEEDAGIGIRFTAQMSASDYTAIQAYGYTDLSYGVLIAPADYVGVKELNAANVFGVGGTKIYDWATWDEATQEWVYTNNGYTQIINLEADELTVNAKDSSIVEFRGSIVNLEAMNKTRAFVGLGYIKYTDETGTNYEFADWAGGDIANNTRSMAQVVESAVTSATSELTAEQKTALTNAYQKNVDYVVRTYQEGADGYENTTEANASAIKAAKANYAANVGETFNATALGNTLAPEGYYLDVWKSGTITENNVPETGRAYFDLYYTKQVNDDYTFEKMGYVPDSITPRSGGSTLSIESITVDGETTKALKLTNVSDSWPHVSFNLGTDFYEDITPTSALKFRVLIDNATCDAEYIYFKVTSEDTPTTWLLQDSTTFNTLANNANVWKEFVIPYADLVKDLGTNGSVASMADSGWMTLYPEMQGVTNKKIIMYVDDIEIIDNVYDFEAINASPSNVTLTYGSGTLSVDEVTVGGETSKALTLVTSQASVYTTVELSTDFFADT